MNEKKDKTEELPESVRIVIKIAKQVDELNLKLPRELIFLAAIQAIFNFKLE